MDQMEGIENTSIEPIKKLDKNSTLMESKNSMIPITPYLTKENVNFTSRVKLNEDDDDPSTPMEDVLDSHKLVTDSNQMNHPGSSVARKLDFRSNECVLENEVGNGSLTETVFESVLEAIIYEHAEEILAKILAPDSSHDVLRTPPVAQVTGLTKTCPGAPLKQKEVRNLKAVNMSLCRKLDFDSYA
ncbi:hypothetical protein R6Q57_017330 [Mikania cordata]